MKSKKLLLITFIIIVSFFNIQKVYGDDLTDQLPKLSEHYKEYLDADTIEKWKKKSIKELLKEAAKISDKTDYDMVCAYQAKRTAWGSNTAGWGNYWIKTVFLYVPKTDSDLPMKTVYIDVYYHPEGNDLRQYDNYTEHVMIDEFTDYAIIPTYEGLGESTWHKPEVHQQATKNYKATCPMHQYLNKISKGLAYNYDGKPILADTTYQFRPNEPGWFTGNDAFWPNDIALTLKKPKGEDKIGYDPETFEPKGDLELSFEIPEEGEIECKDLMTPKVRKQINRILTYVRILVPILIIALGMVDFGKAVIGDKEEEMKKAQSRFAKRLIIGLIIFLLPTILDLILDIANSAWKGAQFKNSNCGL